MLVQISKDTIKYLQQKKPNKKIINAINDVISAMLQNEHIFFGELGDIEYLLECNYIEQRNKEVLEWIIEHYYKVANISELVTYKIVIMPPSNHIVYENNQIKIPLIKLSKLGKSVLSAEHKSDADLYIAIANRFLEFNHLDDTVGINFAKHSFWGGNCDKALEEIFDEQDKVIFCLCIVDSDKEYRNHLGGETARKAKIELAKYREQNAVQLFELDVREKENIIPPSFYYFCHLHNQKVIKFLTRFEKTNPELLRFIDIKEGIRKKNYKKADDKWKKIYLPFLHLCKEENLLNNEIEELSDKNSCISGLGGDASNKFCRLILNRKIREELEKKKDLASHGVNIPIDYYVEACNLSENVIEKLPDYLQNDWNVIYQILFNWGCCMNDSSFLLITGIHA